MGKKMKKLKRLPATILGCLNCGYTAAVLPMKTKLYNSFGGWEIHKDGKTFFVEKRDIYDKRVKTLADIEKEAKKSPSSDWRAIANMALRYAEYQRQRGRWYLVKTGDGFA